MTEDTNKKMLVVGLGNPILGDDGVGWKVVEQVEAALKEKSEDIKFEYLSLGGLALMENMEGFQDVLVVDSIITGTKPNGTIYSLPLSGLPNLSAGHTTSIHDTSLASALVIGRRMGMVLPEDDRVWVVAVEAEYVYDFSEELSEPVEAAVPLAVQIVSDLLLNNFREEKIYDLT